MGMFVAIQHESNGAYEFREIDTPMEHENIGYEGVTVVTIPNWQYHLQSMVISEDPISYLKEHI